MPILSNFYGIIIKMYFRESEHNPPHIHAIYGEYIGIINIQNGKLLEGNFPIRALKLVQEWLEINKITLLEIWIHKILKKYHL